MKVCKARGIGVACGYKFVNEVDGIIEIGNEADEHFPLSSSSNSPYCHFPSRVRTLSIPLMNGYSKVSEKVMINTCTRCGSHAISGESNASDLVVIFTFFSVRFGPVWAAQLVP